MDASARAGRADSKKERLFQILFPTSVAAPSSSFQKDFDIARIKELLGESRPFVFRGEPFRCVALIDHRLTQDGNWGSSSSSEVAGPDGKGKGLEHNLQLNVSASGIKRSDAKLGGGEEDVNPAQTHRPYINAPQFIKLNNGDLVVDMHAVLEAPTGNLFQFSMHLSLKETLSQLEAGLMLRNPVELQKRLQRLLKNRPCVSDSGLSKSVELRIKDPLRLQSSISKVGRTIFISLRICNAHLGKEIQIGDMTFFCDRSSPSGHRKVSLTPLDRFYRIKCKCLAQPSGLKPGEVNSYIVTLKPLPPELAEESTSPMNQADDVLSIRTISANVKYVLLSGASDEAIRANEAKATTDAEGEEEEGERRLPKAMSQHFTIGSLTHPEDSGRELELRFETRAKISLLETFWATATVINHAKSTCSVRLIADIPEHGGLVCEQRDTEFAEIPGNGQSRSATMSFLPVQAGLHIVPLYLVDSLSGERLYPLEPIEIFVG